jgi:hypothetical protein
MVGKSARGAGNLRGAPEFEPSGTTPPAVSAARGHCFDSVLRPSADAGTPGDAPGRVDGAEGRIRP